MSARPIRVLIVDSSALVRQALRNAFSSDPQIQVIATAGDPYIATDRIREQLPDVIIMGIEMPRMDGLAFLESIMSQHPIPVVICSSLVGEDPQITRRAMDLGAIDIIPRPRQGVKEFLEGSQAILCQAVKNAAIAPMHLFLPTRVVQPKLTADVILPPPKASVSATTEKVVVIGASTGGTEALKTVLEMLPADAPGIVIVQHMPEMFTRAFAERLNSFCSISVKEAEPHDAIVQGRALVAPGNHHLLLLRSGDHYSVTLKDGPLVCRHRPSADVLFRSAACVAGSNAIGVLLTGMGDDGAQGMLEMKQAGAFTIAQDEATCVVFGMPMEAIKRGAVDRVLPLQLIAASILSCVR